MLVVKVMLVLVFVNVTIDVGDGPLSICQAKSIEQKRKYLFWFTTKKSDKLYTYIAIIFFTYKLKYMRNL